VAAVFGGARARHEPRGAREGDDQERGGDPASQEGGEALEHLAELWIPGLSRMSLAVLLGICPAYCVFRPKPIRDSGASRSPIPVHADH
jgi:hypothetical protein